MYGKRLVKVLQYPPNELKIVDTVQAWLARKTHCEGKHMTFMATADTCRNWKHTLDSCRRKGVPIEVTHSKKARQPQLECDDGKVIKGHGKVRQKLNSLTPPK